MGEINNESQQLSPGPVVFKGGAVSLTVFSNMSRL